MVVRSGSCIDSLKRHSTISVSVALVYVESTTQTCSFTSVKNRAVVIYYSDRLFYPGDYTVALVLLVLLLF